MICKFIKKIEANRFIGFDKRNPTNNLMELCENIILLFTPYVTFKIKLLVHENSFKFFESVCS